MNDPTQLPQYQDLRVLYLEDDDDDYLLTTELLNTLVSGLQLQRAGSTDAARGMLAREQFDLLLLDVALPAGNDPAGHGGLAFIGHCIDNDVRIPMVLLTGMDQLTLSYRVLELVSAGEMGFIAKNNLDLQRLRRTLGRLMQPPTRMLLVDADGDECKLLEQMVEESRLNRFEIAVVADIDSARKRSGAQSYDAIFVDHNQDIGDIAAYFTELTDDPKKPGMVLITGFRQVQLPPQLLELIELERLLLLPKASLSTYRLTESILYFSKSARDERSAARIESGHR